MSCVLAATPSCTVAGLAIGASEPHYVTELPARDALETSSPPLTVGENVRLKTVGTTDWVHGKYLGDRNRAFVLGKRTGDRVIPYDQITDLEIERGSYAGTGLAIGLVVDVVGVTVVAAVASQGFPSHGSMIGPIR